MSNNYFNRARTAKNRIEDTDDVIELVDSSKHIYYVRTNQHEYLVDLSFTANTGYDTSGNIGYTNEGYDMRIPAPSEGGGAGMSSMDFILRGYDKCLFNEYYRSNGNIIPPIGEYQNGVANSFIFDQNKSNNISEPLSILSDKLSSLGIEEYRDFDYQSTINSRYIDYYKVCRTSNLLSDRKKTPITYCRELAEYGLSWGLPTLEILIAILFKGNLLSDRIRSHYYDNKTFSEINKNIIFGAYTQHFLAVQSDGNNDGDLLDNQDKLISAVQCAISLNRVADPRESNCDFLNSIVNNDAFESVQIMDLSSLLTNGDVSNNPSMIITCNSITSRISMRIPDDTNSNNDNPRKDLPMLIIPTAIIR